MSSFRLAIGSLSANGFRLYAGQTIVVLPPVVEADFCLHVLDKIFSSNEELTARTKAE